MGETNIAWTNFTFNVAFGCEKVSPACDNCYAEIFDRRLGGDHWGHDKPRRVFDEKYWRQPLLWNRRAERDGVMRTVFCSSMADVFEDNAQIAAERQKLWPLIRATPNLFWLLLTKRAPMISRELPADWGDGYANVGLGVTVENQQYANLRLDYLARVKARMRFVSMEPLLGPVSLSRWVGAQDFCHSCSEASDPQGPDVCPKCGEANNLVRVWGEGQLQRITDGLRHDPESAWCGEDGPPIDWVIVGGESGNNPKAIRAMALSAVVDLAKECGPSSDVAFFFKQTGAALIMDGPEAGPSPDVWHPADRKGDTPAGWPKELELLGLHRREFPACISER